MIREPADYKGVMGMSRYLLSSLYTPCFVEETGTFIEGPSRPRFQGVLVFWTDHSPRGFLNSGAAGMGVDKSRRDFLGCWMPQQSDSYIMTARQVVWEIQQQIIDIFRASPGLIDESETQATLSRFMVDRSYPEDMNGEQLQCLALPDAAVGPSLEGGGGDPFAGWSLIGGGSDSEMWGLHATHAMHIRRVRVQTLPVMGVRRRMCRTPFRVAHGSRPLGRRQGYGRAQLPLEVGDAA